MRKLHFFQIIYAHTIFVAFAGQRHFDEVRGDAQLAALRGAFRRVLGQRAVGLVGRLSARDKVSFPDTLGHLREGEAIQPAPHVAVWVAVLQTPGEYLVQGRAGDDSQLA